MNTDMTLKGRVAAVVGAGQGIGRATAEALGSRGARVVVMDRNAEGVQKAVSGLEAAGVEASGEVVDVSQSEQVREVMAKVTADHGAFDILVNSAGVACHGDSL
jgi:meso-butanediol dehydrogenase/(S,S)-butanediol dehydrogenase/diacetyl reductase